MGGLQELTAVDHGTVGAPALFPVPSPHKLLFFLQSYAALPPETKMVIFLEPVFPKSLEMPELLFPWKPSPANLQKEELDSRSHPRHPHHPCSSLQGGPKLKIIPLPQIFPAGAPLLH